MKFIALINKDEKSIHENNFVKIPKNGKMKKLNEKWDHLFKIKQEANIAIEGKKSNQKKLDQV